MRDSALPTSDMYDVVPLLLLFSADALQSSFLLQHFTLQTSPYRIQTLAAITTPFSQHSVDYDSTAFIVDTSRPHENFFEARSTIHISTINEWKSIERLRRTRVFPWFFLHINQVARPIFFQLPPISLFRRAVLHVSSSAPCSAAVQTTFSRCVRVYFFPVIFRLQRISSRTLIPPRLFAIPTTRSHCLHIVIMTMHREV